MKSLIYRGIAAAILLASLRGVAAELPLPHLFFSAKDVPELRRRAESTDWLRQAKSNVIAAADKFLETPTTPYPLLNSGVGIAGRAVQQRVGILAFAGHLTGERKYLTKGSEILLAVVRQTEPRNRAHWLTHLQYADAAQGIAIGYDWLGPVMTDAERAEVRAEIAEFGELLFGDQTIWGKPEPGVSSCNHNAVHFGALGLCALVLRDRHEWLERATTRVRDYLRYFADGTGYVTEGHDYQAYGMLGALPFAWALQRRGGPDLVAEQPVFPRTSDQILWKLLPFGGRMLAMNDNNENACGAAAVYPMLRYRQPLHLWAWLESVKNDDYGVGTLRQGLNAPFLFIWAREALEPQAPTDATHPLGHRFESGRVFLRSSWSDPDAAHVSFTSGPDFHRGHNHQDENAVTLYALGEGFLIDPGYQPYGSRSHNTLRSIDGVEQIPTSAGRLLAYREDKDGAYMRGQAAEAYQWKKDVRIETGLVGHFDRKAYFVRGPRPYLAWRDDAQVEIEGPAPEVVAQFVTYPRNRVELVEGGFVIHGSLRGGRCLVRVASPVAGVRVAEEDLAGQTFETRGRQYTYQQFYRGVTATVVALNPRLISIAVPFRDQASVPKIEIVAEERDRVACLLTFPDGQVDRLVFSEADVEFVRLATGGEKR